MNTLFNLLKLFYKVSLCQIIFYYTVPLCRFVNAELRIREDSKLFIRFNLKINSLEYSTIFAHAIGFRVNFDLRKSKKPKHIYFGNGVSTHLHVDKIRETTKYLFNSYGYNGTSCLLRAMCEISHIPEHSYDLVGPVMKLAFLGSFKARQFNTEICRDAEYCPISVLHMLSHREIG